MTEALVKKELAAEEGDFPASSEPVKYYKGVLRSICYTFFCEKSFEIYFIICCPTYSFSYIPKQKQYLTACF